MLDLHTTQGIPRDETAASFDAILLLAILTCIPDDQGQALLIAGLRRLLRPGRVLYSDMPLQSDRRNLTRYTDVGGSADLGTPVSTEEGSPTELCIA